MTRYPGRTISVVVRDIPAMRLLKRSAFVLEPYTENSKKKGLHIVKPILDTSEIPQSDVYVSKRSILTVEEAKWIAEKLRDGYSQLEIADALFINSRVIIRGIKSGRIPVYERSPLKYERTKSDEI